MKRKGEHSQYPGAPVAPDGEIYFPRGTSEAPADSSPATTDQPDDRKDSPAMSSAPIATVEIDTIDSTGRTAHITHAATRSLQDAFSFIAANAPAPVNRWVQQRIRQAGGGEIQIGQITAVIALLP